MKLAPKIIAYTGFNILTSFILAEPHNPTLCNISEIYEAGNKQTMGWGKGEGGQKLTQHQHRTRPMLASVTIRCWRACSLTWQTKIQMFFEVSSYYKRVSRQFMFEDKCICLLQRSMGPLGTICFKNLHS